MPINFVTGLPRAGKTLWTLMTVDALAKSEGRAVYYCNIPEITLPGWTEIDHPDKWLTLPNGSIIVVDELQDFWGKPASAAAKVPTPILELSKHGKRGFDFFFITQEPNLVHSTPRDLCAYHYYVVRAFGTHNAMTHKFERMQLHPEKVKSKSEKLPWRYPKVAFGVKDQVGNWVTKPWYKSADVHMIKRKIPFKVFAIPIGLLIFAALLFGAYLMFSSVINKAKKGKAQAEAAQTVLPGQSAAGPVVDGQPPAPRVLTAEEYLKSFQPCVPGLAHTAPRYDAVMPVNQAPKPAACIESKSKGCKCFSQQATALQVPLDLCRQFVRNGYFDETLPVQTAAAPGYPAGPPTSTPPAAFFAGRSPAEPVALAQMAGTAMPLADGSGMGCVIAGQLRLLISR